MKRISKHSLAAVEFQLRWESEHGIHTDCIFAGKVDPSWDILPKRLLEQMMDSTEGDRVRVHGDAGEILPPYDPSKRFSVKREQFESNFSPEAAIHPRRGRFYPKGFLKGVPGVFKTNREPFRCVEIDDSGILVDFNHPLAGKRLEVAAVIGEIRDRSSAMGGGGSCNDWMEILTTGPGMQARCNGRSTDFFADHPFERSDENPDTLFYEKPRLVNHIDERAIEVISGLYAQQLHAGSHVLDLMSSWTSHLPVDLSLEGLTGLGLNREELQKNKRLTAAVVHDLNADPVLPFEDNTFDAVICTVSVEYLTQPVAVFRDVGRVLKPDGCFCLTFSNRWFPPKVVRIWQQVQEFERLGLVSEYFLLSESFENIQTFSIRGLPRPQSDKYYGQLLVSDPVFGVWAYRR